MVRLKGVKGKRLWSFLSWRLNGTLSVCCVDGKRDMIQGEGESRAEMQNEMECWVFVSVSLLWETGLKEDKCGAELF